MMVELVTSIIDEWWIPIPFTDIQIFGVYIYELL